jgi:hypothetical protein
VFPDLKLQWLSWGCTPQTPSLGNIWAQATPVTNLQHRILQILRMVQIIQNLRIFFFHWWVKILYICLSCNCVILSTNKGGQQLVCYVCAERQASCTLKNSFYRFRIEYLYIHVYIYIYIKSKAIYQPENLMSNGSSRRDDAAQTK